MFDFLKRRGAKAVSTTTNNTAAGNVTDSATGWETLILVMDKSGQWKKASSIWKQMTAAEKEMAYNAHPVIRACVKLIASTITVPRLELGMWTGKGRDEWKPIPTHWALDLLDKPNNYYTGTNLLQYITSRYVLTGWGYIWKWRNGAGGRVVELWPVPTSWVTPRYGEGNVLYRDFQVLGSSGPVPEADMAYIRQIDPGTTTDVASGMQSIQHDYELDIARQGYQAEMLENLKIPGTQIKLEKRPTPEQREEILKDFEDKFGQGKRGRPTITWGNGSVEIINPLADMDWPGLTGLSETRMCVGFGVPPILVHCRAGLDRATYSNYEQAHRSFYQDTMAPHWVDVADGLTLGLLRREKEFELEFRFRYDELPEFQEDADKANTRTMARYNAGNGILSRDEARAEVGYDPDPEYEAEQKAAEDRMRKLEEMIAASRGNANTKDDPNADDEEEKGNAPKK